MMAIDRCMHTCTIEIDAVKLHTCLETLKQELSYSKIKGKWSILDLKEKCVRSCATSKQQSAASGSQSVVSLLLCEVIALHKCIDFLVFILLFQHWISYIECSQQCNTDASHWTPFSLHIANCICILRSTYARDYIISNHKLNWIERRQNKREKIGTDRNLE